eukprot:CAMPEP_0206459180 /NCGR_PEP_ID=MMETSP0324_2-20121206/24023_1 /ASSEMBLY_ACC=CAM_ASM_000836 /TAXON_ID=2866 /ORGANISM="Crypthecodinium cohnii, Strain Seligo" /LENGTH=524 /DNA_ID=CAMNT_0053930683 /DNA_START=185 /DNA_END=1756 /DNA_ORIENTATION=+
MTEKDIKFATRFVTYIAQNYLNQTVRLHDIYAEMYPQDAKKQLLIKSTCWETLGVFINALAKAGHVEARREVKGWMVRVGQDRLLAAEDIADRWRPAMTPLNTTQAAPQEDTDFEEGSDFPADIDEEEDSNNININNNSSNSSNNNNNSSNNNNNDQKPCLSERASRQEIGRDDQDGEEEDGYDGLSFLAKGSCPEVPVPVTRTQRMAHSWEQMKKKPKRLWDQAMKESESSKRRKGIDADPIMPLCVEGPKTEQEATTTGEKQGTKRTSSALVKFSLCPSASAASTYSCSSSSSSSSSVIPSSSALASSLPAVTSVSSSSCSSKSPMAQPESSQNAQQKSQNIRESLRESYIQTQTHQIHESQLRKTVPGKTSVNPPSCSSSDGFERETAEEQDRLPFLPHGLVVKVKGGPSSTRASVPVPFKAVSIGDNFGEVTMVGSSVHCSAEVKVVPVQQSYGKSAAEKDRAQVVVVPRASIETVIPKLGGKVLILAGKHAGSTAYLKDVDQSNFCCSVLLLHSGAEVR